MNDPPPRKTPGPSWWLFFASCAVYAALLWLGPRYSLETAALDRPMPTVLALYLGACALYLVALRKMLRAADTRALVWWIVGTSIALRLILLPTPPFQEIDIYRYLWDGAVVVEGVDPYAYPPQTVVNAIDNPAGAAHDAELTRLAELARDRPPLEEILRTVHYSELPSPYPPVSQAVFAFASTTCGDWSAETRLVWFKAVLTAFDVGVLLLVLRLVALAAIHRGWALAYGWCPLVLKEVAGSGHLDAVAVLFAIAALAVGAAVMVGGARPRRDAVFASALLGLGVGAKLFPVVLAPLLAIAFWRRIGRRATVAAGAAFLGVSGATLAPMFWPRTTPTPPVEAAPPIVAEETEAVSLPPPPGEWLAAGDAESAGKTAGLTAFLRSWEMNELLFMVLYENLRWHAETPPGRRPWFDATPDSWSEAFRGRAPAAFAVTRAATALGFLAIAVLLAWRAARSRSETPQAAQAWLRAAFLTLAWFWLLAPTQNPWYWCWAAPLLPFARSRAWLFVSVFSFGYYLRFWLESRFPDAGVLGTSYDGEYFFYFVVPWVEFGPILLWLAVEAAWRRRRRAVCSDSQTRAGAPRSIRSEPLAPLPKNGSRKS